MAFPGPGYKSPRKREDLKTDKKETEKEFLKKVELFDSMTTRFLPMWLVEHKKRLISEGLFNKLIKKGVI